MLGYLLEPFIQINTIVGTPVVGAKIYVYKGNTSVLATTYNDFEGHLNTNPVRTNTLGNCTIIADDSISYDIEIRDALGLLLMSKKNITIGNAASGSGELVVEAGYGIEVTRTQGSWKVAVDTDLIATQDDLADKQDKLQAGANIEITNDNIVNVVNRREVVTEWPIKLERGNNRVKFYLDDDYANQFKSKQTPVEYGNEAGKYISYISQNENGEINATTGILPQSTTYSEGTGITITPGESSNSISVDTSVVALKSEIPTIPTISNDVYDYMLVNTSHTLTAPEVANKSFSVDVDLSHFDGWLSTGIITSVPMITLEIYTVGGLGMNEDISYSMNEVLTGGGHATLYYRQAKLTSLGIEDLHTWYNSTPSNLDHLYLTVSWDGSSFSEGDSIYYDITIQAVKLNIT